MIVNHTEFKIIRSATLLCALLIFFANCSKDESVGGWNYLSNIPKGFPIPEIPIDDFPTEAKIFLGKRLFYDPILSSDSTKSCSSCHMAHLAFSDSIALSEGIKQRIGTRNAPSLSNVVYQKALLREGGLPSLEMQVLVPIQEHNEFDENILNIVERLNNSPTYVALSNSAFNRNPDPFVITRSIAAFERTFLSGNSNYDKYTYQGKLLSLTQVEKNGMDLFFSEKTNCSSCHSGFLFSNLSFENNGIYAEYNDPGRKRLTLAEEDEGKFKVPSLRNVEITSPYMHDGSFKTLESVIDHYNSGGFYHKNKNKLIRPLNLTNIEKSELIAFLKSLTDREFINNQLFRNE